MIRPSAKLNRLDRMIGYFSPKKAFERLSDRTRMKLAASYRGADMNRLRADWILGQSETTPSSWTLQTLRERSRDLNRNDAVASGATDTLAINIVGQGLRPQARIRPQYIGISDDRARDLQRQAELIWQTWIPDADSGNRLTFDEIQFLAIRKIIEDGEVIALPIMAPEKWRQISRAVELIEADRLSGPAQIKGAPLNDTGIEVGRRGQPKTYWIRKADAKTGGKQDYLQVAARDNKGRPKILHVFQTKRPGQLRGVPVFAPVLTLFKDLADYMEAEVVAARVAACLAVFVTKTDAYAGAYGASDGTETGTNKRIQGIEPGLVGYLEPGEAINVVDPKRPGDSFAPFVEGVLRMIGMSLNLSYELLAKDFSKTNYSSARAALLEGRRMFTTWRIWFARRFCQPLWDLVLEEAYLRGLFDVPDFYKYRSEYTRCTWLGGAWGWVDPVKEVEASRKAIDYGLSTLAEETAGQGRDWEEVLEQRAREDETAKDLGVEILRAGKAGQTNGGQGDEDAKTEKE